MNNSVASSPIAGRTGEIAVVLALFLLLVLGCAAWAQQGGMMAIWPANGVLLGYLLARPEIPASRLLIAGLAANLLARMVAGETPATATVLASINLLEIWLALLLARRRPGLRTQPDMRHAGDVVHYLVQVCLAASAVAAVLAAGFLSWVSSDSFLITFVSLWLAGFLGLATCGVLIMEMLHPKFVNSPRRGKRLARLLMAVAVCAVIAWAIFSQTRYPLLYVFAPLTMGVAYLSGPRGAVAGILSVAAVASWFTVHGSGPLALIPHSSLPERMLALQVFLLAGAFTLLPFTAALAAMYRQRAESHEALSKMLAIMATAPVGIAFTRNRKFELVNTTLEAMFGYRANELTGLSPRMIYESDAFYEALGPRVAAAFQSGLPFSEEINLVRKDGSRFWGRLQGAPVRAGDPSAGTIWIIEDVTDARAMRERLSWASTHDPLTRLVNRQEFEARVSDWLQHRSEDSRASSLFIDLDRFKAVNDVAGHAAGDRMLQEISGVLNGAVRHGDTVARLGGDEFAILLPSCDSETAERIAHKLCRAVEAHSLKWEGHQLEVGASVGLIEIDARYQDVAAVLAAADRACYEAKRAGRNTVRRG